MLARYMIAASLVAGPVTALAAQTPAAAPDTTAQTAKFTALGKTYIRWMMAGRADSLATGFDPSTLEQMGGAAALRENMDKLSERAGSQTTVIADYMTRRNSYPQFWHEANFSGMDEPVVIRFVLDKEGKIIGTGVGPKSRTPAIDQ